MAPKVGRRADPGKSAELLSAGSQQPGRRVSNWATYDASFAAEWRIAAANPLVKLRTHRGCCGNQLRAPASDARALALVPRDPGIGDFEVRTLLNEPAHEVNLAVEEFFADRHADDLLLLHFSCHEVKDEDGELYFATADTRLRRLGATAVAAEFVNRRMSRSRSRRVAGSGAGPGAWPARRRV